MADRFDSWLAARFRSIADFFAPYIDPEIAYWRKIVMSVLHDEITAWKTANSTEAAAEMALATLTANVNQQISDATSQVTTAQATSAASAASLAASLKSTGPHFLAIDADTIEEYSPDSSPQGFTVRTIPSVDAPDPTPVPTPVPAPEPVPAS